MNWSKLISEDRLGGTSDEEDWKGAARTEFEKDIDRIVYSGSFRRLARKTQVHPLAANDHVHTRLTHSLKTSRVGRELGKAAHRIVGDDVPNDITEHHFGDIVQAACLAHDIGNPPFGHASEEAIMHWCESNLESLDAELTEEERTDIRFFDGNAQGFRILTQLENHIFSGGLRLTYSTLATFLKYPTSPTEDSEKSSCFLSEKRILDEVAEEVGLPRKGDGYARHPLAFLVEAADDICYGVLDLEDAVELKILRLEELTEIFKKLFDSESWDGIHDNFEDKKMFRVNLARLRGPVFEELIKGAMDGFRKAKDSIMEGAFPEGDTLFDALDEEDPRRVAVDEAKALARERVYIDPKKIEVELGSYAILDELLSELLTATVSWSKAYQREKKNKEKRERKKTSSDWRSRLVLQLLGDHAPSPENRPGPDDWTDYLCMRRGVDFVAGCTDNYASYVAKQMRGMAFAGLQRP